MTAAATTVEGSAPEFWRPASLGRCGQGQGIGSLKGAEGLGSRRKGAALSQAGPAAGSLRAAAGCPGALTSWGPQVRAPPWARGGGGGGGGAGGGGRGAGRANDC